MSDLIDRQAAIDEIEKTIKVNESVHYEMKYWKDGMNCAKDIIEEFPSAQPEPIKINIEDFNKEDWERLKKEWGNTPITVLPAQPEIIKCKDCLHWVRTCGDNQWGLGDCDVFDRHLVMCEGYCAWAERRTDERLN